MILTDTHTHLYLPEFEKDIDQVLRAAENNGVSRIFLPNIDASSIEAMLELSKKYPQKCFPMMGLHPCSVSKNYTVQLEEMKEWFSREKFYAVGEIGIDLYWDKTLLPEQQQAFRTQIGWAKEMRLPIVIHVRESFNEVFEIIDELNDDRLTGIFHCFTGDEAQAKKVIDYGGFKLGIGGVVTYKTSALPEVLKTVDLKHIVLETDAPYLPPVPFRGKRNESAYIMFVAKKLSEIYNTTVNEIAEVTTQNSKEVFGV